MSTATTNPAKHTAHGHREFGQRPAHVNGYVQAWVDESIALLKPDRVFWCDGSVEGATSASPLRCHACLLRSDAAMSASVVVRR